MRKKRSNAVCVLVSGGVDSAVLVADRLLGGEEVYPLYVRCGLRWEQAEIASLRRYLAALGTRRWPGKLRPLTVGTASVRSLFGQHWSLGGSAVPGAAAAWDSVFLPGRNLMLLTEAGIFCAAQGIPVVVQALLKGNPFKDAAPGFRRRMERVLADSLSWKIRVEAPYAKLSKAQVVARVPGLPLHLAFSCLKPSAAGRQCGRCSKCAERLGRAPEDPEGAGFDRAVALFNAGSFVKAARAFEKISSPRARVFEGHAWRSAGRIDLAAGAFARAKNREGAEGLEQLRRLSSAGSAGLRADIFAALKAGRAEAAVRAAERLERAGLTLSDARALWEPWPVRPGARVLKALARSRSPWARYFLGCADPGRRAAARDLDFAAARRPWMSLKAGWSRLMRGEAAAAAPRLKRALAGEPRDWKARGYLAEAYLCLGRPSEARRQLVLAVAEAGAERGHALAWQGALELWLGAYAKAARLLQRARAEGSDLALTWSAGALILSGRPRKALPLLDRALKLHPGDREAWVWRGEAKRLLGERAGALKDLERAGDMVWAKLNAALCGRPAVMSDVPSSFVAAFKKGSGSSDPVAQARWAFSRAKGWRRDDYAQAFWLP